MANNNSGKNEKDLVCSFCGKHQDEVEPCRPWARAWPLLEAPVLMPFEFAFLDWLQQFHNPVLDALAVFLNYAGEHGEIWIAFTLLLLLFRRTRKAGCAMATALVQ